MQGWLKVYDIQGLPSHQLSCGQVVPSYWNDRFCYLEQQTLWIVSKDNQFFHEGATKSPPDESEDVFNAAFDENLYNPTKDHSDARRRRQESEGGVKDGLPNFIQKKIQPGVRRSKSAKINGGKENRPLERPSFFNHGNHSRNASEPEIQYFMPPIESPDQLDLSSPSLDLSSAKVRPLHHSILGKDYCFEVLTHTNGNRTPVARCFGCSSNGEREAWIEKIKRAINPNLDNSLRVEDHLSLYVQEAKGLPSKKKYFCEICLDSRLCARTSSKWKQDSSILWGEGFEFTCLSISKDITVHLYKDTDKKKKKDKDYIGLVNLSVNTLLNHNFVEKWYNLSTPSGNNKNKAGEAMAIRLKARFLSTRVLPTEQYKSFAEYLSNNYLNLCRTLGPTLTAQQKDEVAKILVKIMYATGSIKDYMTNLVMDEVEQVEEESLIFRENTVGTKSVEAFLRLVGMKYLHRVFGDFISTIFSTPKDYEVDGSRLPANADLLMNQENLRLCCGSAVERVCKSVEYFPMELREVFSTWHRKVVEAGRPRIAFRLITASLFLRLLCPAILNPILFGLANQIPDSKTARSLTLVAKVVQNLANRSRFGSKEEYMQFMDQFVRERWDDMTSFVDNLSNRDMTSSAQMGFEGYIDLGREFARLHSFFSELMPALDAATFSALHPLPEILSNISDLLDPPQDHPQVLMIPPIREEDPTSEDQPSSNLNSILEDAPLSSAREEILLPPSSSVMTSQPPHSSLMDLRDLTNGDQRAGSLHGSHVSLAMTNDHQGAPLKFRNPIFRGNTNVNNSSSIMMPTSDRSRVEGKPPISSAGTTFQPLSFVNPLIKRSVPARSGSDPKENGDSLESRISSNSSAATSANRKSLGGAVAVSTGDDQLVVIESSVKVSNAHLKTGLNQKIKSSSSKIKSQRRSSHKTLEDENSKDGLVTPEVTSTTANFRVAANVSSSNAAGRGKTSKRSYSDHRYPQKLHQRPQRRSPHHQESTSTGFPPSSSEDALSPEARTAQWVLNSIQKSPTFSDPERSSGSTIPAKDYQERIIQLESQLDEVTGKLREKVLQLHEAKTSQKRTLRDYDILRTNMENLNCQLEAKSKQLIDANSRESQLMTEIFQLRDEVASLESLLSSQRSSNDQYEDRRSLLVNGQPDQ